MKTSNKHKLPTDLVMLGRLLPLHNPFLALPLRSFLGGALLVARLLLGPARERALLLRELALLLRGARARALRLCQAVGRQRARLGRAQLPLVLGLLGLQPAEEDLGF